MELREETWNWLPAFLQVAESGSIVAAARQLDLTPAAVSRTVRLLEDRLGQPLFTRVGRSVALNARGEALRDAVRDAVGSVDRGLLRTRANPFARPLRVASLGVLSEHFVVDALLDLKRDHPELTPEHQNLRTAEANQALAQGALDVAFYYEALSAEPLRIERLGQTTTSVYCGCSHPLFRARRVTRKQLLSHPFSVPQLGDSGRILDGWPSELQREVGMRISLLRSNLKVCLSGALLTVLPDITALDALREGRLRRFAVDELHPIEVFTAQHEADVEQAPTHALVERVRQRLNDAQREIRAVHRGRRG